MKNLIIYLLLITTFCSCQKEKEKVDLIITNAVIWTGNKGLPYANSMAIADGKILAIGSMEKVATFESKKTRTTNLDGLFVTPGFIDCHVHLISGGRSLLNVNLRDAKTQEGFSLTMLLMTEGGQKIT